MKKSLLKICINTSLLSLLAVTNVYAVKEVTVCFAKGDCNDQFSYATIGEDVKLCGGQCSGKKTIIDMYKDGWQLNTFIGGLSGSFGLIFEKDTKIINKK